MAGDLPVVFGTVRDLVSGLFPGTGCALVVFDRVRENFRRDRGATPAEIINNSLNQTLSRTLVTYKRQLLVLIALALLGGEMIFAFAIALIVGIVVGTYSSIYVASNLLLVQKMSREDFMEQEKAADDMP